MAEGKTDGDDAAKRAKRAEPVAEARRRAIPAPAARGSAAPAAETPEPGEVVVDAPATAPASRRRASEKDREEKPPADARGRASREPKKAPDQAAAATEKKPAAAEKKPAAAKTGADDKGPRETAGGNRAARSREEKPAAVAVAAKGSGRSSKDGGKEKEKDREARVAIPTRKEQEKVCLLHERGPIQPIC